MILKLNPTKHLRTTLNVQYVHYLLGRNNNCFAFRRDFEGNTRALLKFAGCLLLLCTRSTVVYHTLIVLVVAIIFSVELLFHNTEDDQLQSTSDDI